MTRRSSCYSLGFALALFLCLLGLQAQTVTGSITGTVTDPSGAAIANAHLTAHKLDTGVDTTRTSNRTGLYRIDFLPIGHYQVTIEAEGFEKDVLQPFTLEVLETPTINVQMKVGSSVTTVSVTDAAAILNTTNPTLGSTFSTRSIENLPLNGLDFSALTLYMPGSVDTAGTAGTGGSQSIERSVSWQDTPNMNGNRLPPRCLQCIQHRELWQSGHRRDRHYVRSNRQPEKYPLHRTAFAILSQLQVLRLPRSVRWLRPAHGQRFSIVSV